MQIIRKLIVPCFLVILIMISCSLTTFADGEEVIPASTDTQISAKSAILIEASTGQVLFEKDAQNPYLRFCASFLFTFFCYQICYLLSSLFYIFYIFAFYHYSY